MSSFSCLDASVAVKPVFDRFQTVVITSGVSVFVIYFSSFKNDMNDIKLVQYLELMKKDIYMLSNKFSQIHSDLRKDLSLNETQELLQTSKLDRIENTQEKIIQSLQQLSNRISQIELNNENTNERVEDIHTEFITFKHSMSNRNNEKIKKNAVSKSNIEYEEVFDEKDRTEEVFSKISEIEEHFSTEIAKVYDKMFSEILDLKSEIEKIK